jgi:hypothetical protein
MDVDKNLRIMAIKMTLSTILQLYHSDSSIEHLLWVFFPDTGVPINVMYVLEFTIFHATSNARVLS